MGTAMPDGTVAFVCAMPMELTPLRKRLGLRRTDLGGAPAYVGTLDGRPVVAIVTGMGPALATAGIEHLLDAASPALVVVVGITGAVDDATPLGTLVRPARVIEGATGRQHVHEPLDGGETAGALWTTDAMTPAADLPALRDQGVVALDMETAAIAQACEARGVRWSVVRAYSDRATDGSVDDEVFHLSHQDGSPDPGAVLRYVVRHPGRVPGLVRMGRDANRATRRAAEAAVAAVEGFSRAVS
jgi:adenosylhomocysteine nucleosidase